MIKMAEQAAVSGSEPDKKQSLSLLRRLNCEKDLNMDIASPTTGGLAGLFLQVAPDDSRQLYFAVTGKPYNDNKGGAETISYMPDSYLGHHVVGTVIPGLSLKRFRVEWHRQRSIAHIQPGLDLCLQKQHCRTAGGSS